MRHASELNAQSLRFLTETRQRFDAFQMARRKAAGFAGGMSWKTVKGADYLVRVLDREGRQKSLGRRSPETEAAYAQFVEGKELSQARLATARESIGEQAKLNRAIGLGHMQLLPAKILRELDRRGALGGAVSVVGTHALFAYEAMAGVRVPDDMMETGDLDILWDARVKLTLTAAPGEERGLIGLLRSVDRSFEANDKAPYQAVAASGFSVDIIKAEAVEPWRDSMDRLSADDLAAAPIASMRWLINAPKVETTIIDARGFPTPIVAPDPRAFALHKAALAQRDDRDPVKKPRDAAQARIVAEIVREKLPLFPLTPDHLRMFPRAIVEAVPQGTDDEDAFWSEEPAKGPPTRRPVPSGPRF